MRTKRPKRKKERTGISLPAELMAKGQKRAAAMGRSFSGHLSELIRRDLELSLSNT